MPNPFNLPSDPFDSADGQTFSAEEALSGTEAAISAFGMNDFLNDIGANVQAFAAMSATIVLILQDIENSDCACDVCETLKILENAVRNQDV